MDKKGKNNKIKGLERLLREKNRAIIEKNKELKAVQKGMDQLLEIVWSYMGYLVHENKAPLIIPRKKIEENMKKFSYEFRYDDESIQIIETERTVENA